MPEEIKEKITPQEIRENTRDIRDIMHSNQLSAEQRTSLLADEFTRLEVQIATVLFAFSGIFWSSFSDNLGDFSLTAIFVMKISFSFALLSLIGSLTLGLLHLKSAEKFWDTVLHQRIIRLKQWNKVARKEVSFEQADAYHQGTAMEQGSILYSPSWTWIMQSIFLGISILLLYALAMVFLFAK